MITLVIRAVLKIILVHLYAQYTHTHTIPSCFLIHPSYMHHTGTAVPHEDTPVTIIKVVREMVESTKMTHTLVH